MGIEVRNFKPLNNSSNNSITSPITFDLVATNEDQVDIDSLQVEVLTYSNIVSGETGQINYTIVPQGYSYGYDDPDVCGDSEDYYDAIASALSYEGNCIFFKVVLDPAQPFDLGQTIQVTIKVATTAGVSMTPYIVSFTTVRIDIISDFEYVFIHNAQNIPIYYEKMRKNSDLSPRIFNTFCGNLNFKPRPIVRYNEVIVSPEGSSFCPPYKIDYDNGLVIFDTALDRNDMIDISYSFRFFSKEQINLFFQQAASIWRISPLYGGPSTIYSADQTQRDIIMIGAAAFAYRALFASLAYQEQRLIFDNHSWEQGWIQIKDLFKSLWESYEKMWELALKGKAARLPQIASVVTPEFSMPGGRSRLFRYMYKSGV